MKARDSRETFNRKYAAKKSYWGNKPSDLIKEFSGLAIPGHALDLGMGEGRDAIHLAEQGFAVTGVEQSEVGVEKCRLRAEKAGLRINAVVGDVRDFRIAAGKYAIILSNRLFQFITKSEAQQISTNIIRGLKRGGIVLASVFTYDDPRYREYKKKMTELEPGTFLTVGGDVYTLYDYRELQTLFDPLRVLHYSEYDYYHAQHGNEHWHGVADLVARKT